MRKIIETLFGFIKKYKIVSTVVVLALIIIIWFIYKNGSKNEDYNEVEVIKGSITEIVSVTGKVKPSAEVTLAFERGGRLTNINVSVGDSVSTGQYLASVSNADLLANLDQAKANLKKALAQYQDTKIGTRAEEITLQETQLEKTIQDSTQDRLSLIDVIKDSYTKVDDAVRNKIFSLFTNPSRYQAQLNFTTNSFLKEDIEEGKEDLTDMLDAWYRSLNKFTGLADLETYYLTAKDNLIITKKLLDKCALAVNGLDIGSDGITQTQIDTWKLNISTARTNIDLAIGNLATSYNNYTSSVLAVKVSQDQLAIKKAGSTYGSILSAEASYEGAVASVASAEAEIAKTIIRSPINGIVSKADIKLGELVSINTNVISVISSADYEIESFIPEADISKIKISDTAKITLDAYGDSVIIDTVVTNIDPAATVIDGVPTYKIILKFVDKDERVRAGMTANLDILTNKKDDVLVLPNRLVINRDQKKYVSIIDPTDKSKLLEKEIKTGLRGSEGNVEIIFGLNEGDKVITPVY